MKNFSNKTLSKPLALMAQLMELRGESRFKYQAYEKAALNIRNHSEPLYDLIKEGKIRKSGRGLLDNK